MATQKKRIVISLSEERAEEFEKLVRESGLTKSTLVTTWILKEIEKGQEK
ncbi:transcriptional regulator [Streptococcus suis]|nr:transcriptional regulator [Streptococcus suis]